MYFFFFKQKTAYEMRISDWSSDVCSSDLIAPRLAGLPDVAAADIAGPGFINIRLTPAAWRRELDALLTEGADYGRLVVGSGQRVNVEYLSATTHAPIPMGNCRDAVVGGSPATVLSDAVYQCPRDYYHKDKSDQDAV